LRPRFSHQIGKGELNRRPSTSASLAKNQLFSTFEKFSKNSQPTITLKQETLFQHKITHI